MNILKTTPFNKTQIEILARQNPTPFYVYDETGIRASARKLLDAFHWNDGFKEYFAVKATPNPHILQILKQEGCGADCSSMPELLMAERIGITGEDIMFSSNDTPAAEFLKAKTLDAIINLDDFGHISYLERHAGLPDFICCRYNPGSLQSGTEIIGSPLETKFGMTRAQIIEAYRILKGKGVRRFGLHTMPISNELRASYFVAAARNMFDLVLEIKESTGVEIEFVNLGGGWGIPYKPEDLPLDAVMVSQGIRGLYEDFVQEKHMPKMKIFLECGRYVTGPHGYLVSTVRHIKETYKKYVGLDACMANLMRPGMYKTAYHYVSILGKDSALADMTYDVVGSLCENSDKFAIDRKLPKIEPGDIVVIHDAGSHGHAMGFNYNGKLRSAEFLFGADGSFRMIRRAETIDDLFATLTF